MVAGATTYHINGRNHSNWLFESAEWAARKICHPFTLACRDVVDLTQEWHPGAHQQYSTAFSEMFHRTYLTMTFILRISIGLGFWLIGKTISSIMHTDRKDFTFVSLPVHDNARLDLSRVNVLTYNVCLGPEWMVAANKLRPTSERVHEVAETIRRSHCDIVCLQEVFDEETAEVLKEKLQAQGYTYFIYNAGPSSWKLNSGLFIASKVPLSNPTYWKFDASSGWDSYSGKGVLAATVTIAEKQFALFNTHLNGPASNERQARQEQMGELLQHVDGYTHSNGLEGNFIGCGDFNETSLSQTCPRFDRRFTDLPIYNEAGTLFDVDHDPIVGRNKRHLNRWTLIEGAIDHIFTSSQGNVIRPLYTYASRGGGASDHLSVAASFSTRRRRSIQSDLKG